MEKTGPKRLALCLHPDSGNSRKSKKKVERTMLDKVFAAVDDALLSVL